MPRLSVITFSPWFTPSPQTCCAKEW